MNPAAQPIIVVKKNVHGSGHHGGAWKVAYADFVTAMMAFFLVMWLVGQSKAVRAGVGGYFRDPAVFEAQNGKGVLPGGTALEAGPEPQRQPQPNTEDERVRLEAAARHIREQLEQVAAFKTLRNQIQYTVSPEGLRIDLIEQDESTFFDSGSATLRGESEHILGVIARELGTLNEGVVIEGHTDSRVFTANARYSNWELSADRANAARRVVEREGLRQSQIISIRGLADRQLQVPSDPLDPRNRRVSILVPSLQSSGLGAAAGVTEKPTAPTH